MQSLFSRQSTARHRQPRRHCSIVETVMAWTDPFDLSLASDNILFTSCNSTTKNTTRSSPTHDVDADVRGKGLGGGRLQYGTEYSGIRARDTHEFHRWALVVVCGHQIRRVRSLDPTQIVANGWGVRPRARASERVWPLSNARSCRSLRWKNYEMSDGFAWSTATCYCHDVDAIGTRCVTVSEEQLTSNGVSK